MVIRLNCIIQNRLGLNSRDIYAAEGELERRVRAWSVERQEQMDCLGSSETSSVQVSSDM